VSRYNETADVVAP